jgi:hypothetical protein
MPRKGTSARQRREDLLAKIPPSAKRIKVKTVKGVNKFRERHEIRDDDVIQVNVNGDPIVMKSSPGRKAKPPAVGPATTALAQVLQNKQQAIKTDPLLNAIEASMDSADVLHEVIKGIGEEAANIKFEKEQAALEGKDTTGHSAKRIQALKATAETWLKRQDQLTTKTVDLESAAYGALFQFTMESFRDAMGGARLREEQIEMVFTKFSEMVGSEEWVNEARIRMKKAGGG